MKQAERRDSYIGMAKKKIWAARDMMNASMTLKHWYDVGARAYQMPVARWAQVMAQKVKRHELAESLTVGGFPL